MTMWLHYVIFIVFIVLTICGGGGKINLLVDVAKRAGIGGGSSSPHVDPIDNVTKHEHKLLQTEPFDKSSSPSATPPEDLPCLDKLLSLEERINEADFIFTGRVQWIGGTITHRETSSGGNETTGPGGRIGGVSVLHFLKGSKNSPEKEFLVEGFESPLLCRARSKVREEWIFLTSKISGKHVGLVSSLLHLRRRNLRRIRLALAPPKGEHFMQQQVGPPFTISSFIMAATYGRIVGLLVHQGGSDLSRPGFKLRLGPQAGFIYLGYRNIGCGSDCTLNSSGRLRGHGYGAKRDEKRPSLQQQEEKKGQVQSIVDLKPFSFTHDKRLTKSWS